MEKRYKITITREDQPAHQMAEMTATLPGGMLLSIVEAMIDPSKPGGALGWLHDGPASSFDFGNFKSLTISRVDPSDD